MKIPRRKFILASSGLLIPKAFDIFIPNAKAATYFAKASAGGGGAAVAFDSAFEKGLNTTSPFTFASNAGDTTGTVGSGSNRFLVGYVVFRGITATGVSMTWNGVSMTQIDTTTYNAAVYSLFTFGLVAPTTGNQTLSVSWTGGASDVALGAVSLYNVNQGGVGSGSTQNTGNDTGTGTSASSTVTSANGNAVVVAHSNNNASSTTQNQGTQAWKEEDLNGNSAMAYKLSTGSSETVSWTLGSSVEWKQLKVGIVKA